MDAISTRREELLLEEAREFALHCDAEVALVIFTADGKRHEFATSRYNSIFTTITPSTRSFLSLSCLLIARFLSGFRFPKFAVTGF